LADIFALNRGSVAMRAPPEAIPDLAEESPGLARGIIAVHSDLSAKFPDQRRHRADRWCCDLDEAAQSLHSGDECIDLQGSASFEILQHRHFVTDDITGCVQSPRHYLLRNDETERLALATIQENA
jgi:hypothetical protein